MPVATFTHPVVLVPWCLCPMSYTALSKPLTESNYLYVRGICLLITNLLLRIFYVDLFYSIFLCVCF